MTSRPDIARILELERLALEQEGAPLAFVITRDLQLVRSSPALAGLLLPVNGNTAVWPALLAEPVELACRLGRALLLETPAQWVDHGLPPRMRVLPLGEDAPGPEDVQALRLEFLPGEPGSHGEGDRGEHSRQARLECLGVLAGGLAHQFNNLLLGILGHSELLARQCTDPLAHEQLEPIRDSALKARDLTREVLGLLDCRTPRRVPLDLDAFLENLDRLARFGLPAGVRLRVESTGGPARVLADPDHLLLILLACIRETGQGLLPDGDSLILEHGCDPRPAQESCWITVRSAGNRVRSPFPGHSPLLEEARSSAAALDGRLETLLDARGQRCCRLHLPAASPGRSHGQRELLLGNPREGVGRTVLVIDDEAGVREVLAKLLQTRGYDVLTADSGREGLACFTARHDPISLVLLDLSMPGMTGQETCRALLEHDPATRVILMSGVDARDRQEADPCGARAFLAKPFTIQTLFGVLQAVNGNGESHPQAEPGSLT